MLTLLALIDELHETFDLSPRSGKAYKLMFIMLSLKSPMKSTYCQHSQYPIMACNTSCTLFVPPTLEAVLLGGSIAYRAVQDTCNETATLFSW